jgi:tetratricopeptide (TPR) repeat protein
MFPRSIKLLVVLLCLSTSVFTQEENLSKRISQWEAYELPTTNFVRSIDKKHGLSIWRPESWTENRSDESITFRASEEGPALFIVVETIPEGYGLANYTTALLQQYREQSIDISSVSTRNVLLSGIEGRELTFEIEGDDGINRRTIVWLTTFGPHAYLFMCVCKAEDAERYEPYFKRMLLTARIGTAGHWNEEFEDIRAKVIDKLSLPKGREIKAAAISEKLRSGSEPTEQLIEQIASLSSSSPDVVLDLLTDTDPYIRATTLEALAKQTDKRFLQAIIWAIKDSDSYCSSIAAKTLATFGSSGLDAIKRELSTLVEKPELIIRIGAALDNETAKSLATELINSSNSKFQIAGLHMLLALPLEGFDLPYTKLLSSYDELIFSLTLEAIRLRQLSNAAPYLLTLKSIPNNREELLAHTLGDIGSTEIIPHLSKRIEELDKQIGFKASKRPTSRPTNIRPQVIAPPPAVPSRVPPLPPTVSVKAPPPPASYNSQQSQAISLKISLELAIRKINLRDRLAKIKDEADRKAIYNEIQSDYHLEQWSKDLIKFTSPINSKTPTITNAIDVPTTGETLFPESTTLYLMIPNVNQTLTKIDSAFSNIQMATVRDQITLAFVIKMFKSYTASGLGMVATKDIDQFTGVDLTSPLSMASWPIANSLSGEDYHSAVTLRVKDRARFERLLADYQSKIGGFDSLVNTSSSMVRLSGILPGAVPLYILGASKSSAYAQASGKGNSSIHIRRVQLNNLPITIIERLRTYERLRANLDAIYITYLGSTAIIASSKAALMDLLQAEHKAIKDDELFMKARNQKGEMIFFSRPSRLFETSSNRWLFNDKMFSAIAKEIKGEYGNLSLSQNSLETAFNIDLEKKSLAGSIKPFKEEELTIPRKLLPEKTLLYVGGVFDIAKLDEFLKDVTTPTKDSLSDEETNRLINDAAQGEMGIALLKISSFTVNDLTPPTLVTVMRLKEGSKLVDLFRAGKLYPKTSRLKDVTILGSPVVSSPGDRLFITVVDNYIIYGLSLEALKLLESEKRFASTNDYKRSIKALPNNLIFFSTYNLETALDEVRGNLPNEYRAQTIFTVFSAVIHAFHSQHAFLSAGKERLEGKMAVSFDREGRYGVGEIANQVGELDVTNASIPAKGLKVADSKDIEHLRVRITSKRPDVIPRVREDLIKYGWQKVESSDSASLILSAKARHIPEKVTINLPVTGAEFESYLKPTSRINSNSPEIISLAQKIVGKDRDGRSVAKKLGDWTYKNLVWKRVEGSSVETAASKEADCLEHSELYVALARSLGLPARVVSGAALTDGAFGSHAWVEIYLGEWMEVDPTWGLLDHVDSTHLRFDGETFHTYAMLNQIEMEVLESKTFIADFQYDPVRLIKELGTSKNESTQRAIFNFNLMTNKLFGSEVFNGLDDKQRSKVIQAFDNTCKKELGRWNVLNQEDIRILRTEIKEDYATVHTVMNDDLLKFELSRFDKVWYITEIEDADNGLRSFSETLRGAIYPDKSMAKLISIESSAAIKRIDQLISKEGETPSLLFLKLYNLWYKHFPLIVDSEDKEESKKAREEILSLHKRIIAKWPDYIPAYLFARKLLSIDGEMERSVELLKHYSQRVPFDPRVWIDLGDTYEEKKRIKEAEEAYQKALSLDPENTDYQSTLIAFYLNNNRLVQAKENLSKTLKTTKDTDTSLTRLLNKLYFIEKDPAWYQRAEELLLTFPKEVSNNKEAIKFLARVQNEQGKYLVAMRTMQKALVIKPESTDYSLIAYLSRSSKKYQEALVASDKAIKLDNTNTDAHFEKACALVQLGKKQEAVESIKKLIEFGSELEELLEEEELKPLADLPAVKSLLTKTDQ